MSKFGEQPLLATLTQTSCHTQHIIAFGARNLSLLPVLSQHRSSWHGVLGDLSHLHSWA